MCAGAAYVCAPTSLHRLAALFYLNNLYFFGFDWGFFSGRWPSLNQSMWMVPYEVNLYLAFVVAACLGQRLLLAVSLVVLAGAVFAVQPSSGGGLFEAWSPYFAGFFAAGVLLRQFERLRQGDIVLVMLLSGLVAIGFGAHTAGLLLIIPPAAVWLGMRSWPVLRSAARFGDLSYGIFLWAWPVQQLAHLWLPASMSMLAQLAIVVPPVLGLAWLSWRFIEAPAMRLRPRVPAIAARFDIAGFLAFSFPSFVKLWRRLLPLRGTSLPQR